MVCLIKYRLKTKLGDKGPVVIDNVKVRVDQALYMEVARLSDVETGFQLLAPKCSISHKLLHKFTNCLLFFKRRIKHSKQTTRHALKTLMTLY